MKFTPIAHPSRSRLSLCSSRATLAAEPARHRDGRARAPRRNYPPRAAGGRGGAWRNGRWDSVEHFKRVQRKWAIWGAVIWIGMLVLFGGVMGGVFYGFR